MILSSYGVLGINSRNQDYLQTSRATRRILDSKLLTKEVLKKAGLPILEAFAIIKTRKELVDFDFESLPNTFALKPNRGFGGGGIIIIYGRRKKALQPTWITAEGFITEREIKTHL